MLADELPLLSCIGHSATPMTAMPEGRWGKKVSVRTTAPAITSQPNFLQFHNAGSGTHHTTFA